MLALDYKIFISVEGVTCSLWVYFWDGGEMCHIWISCEGSEANIGFGFFITNFGIFF